MQMLRALQGTQGTGQRIQGASGHALRLSVIETVAALTDRLKVLVLGTDERRTVQNKSLLEAVQ